MFRVARRQADGRSPDGVDSGEWSRGLFPGSMTPLGHYTPRPENTAAENSLSGVECLWGPVANFFMKITTAMAYGRKYGRNMKPRNSRFFRLSATCLQTRRSSEWTEGARRGQWTPGNLRRILHPGEFRSNPLSGFSVTPGARCWQGPRVVLPYAYEHALCISVPVRRGAFRRARVAVQLGLEPPQGDAARPRPGGRVVPGRRPSAQLRARVQVGRAEGRGRRDDTGGLRPRRCHKLLFAHRRCPCERNIWNRWSLVYSGNPQGICCAVFDAARRV